MKKQPLRPYQKRDYCALVAALERLTKHETGVLFVAPTGYGKTRIAGEIAINARKEGKRAIFLAPWRELIPQTVDRFQSLGIDAVSVMMSGYEYQRNADIIVGSVETVRRWQPEHRDLQKMDYVIIDEAHRFDTELRKDLLAKWKHAKRIGITATPFKAGTGGLGDVFDSIVHGASTAELIELGWLVPPVFYAQDPSTMKSYKVIHQGHEPIAPRARKTPDAVGDIIEEWQKYGVGTTLAFCGTVEESIELAERFQEIGVTAEHIDSNTPQAERDATLKRFGSGATQVVCNHNILSEGYDLPSIETVILRKTGSLSSYLQQVGRGLRPAENKTHCVILDPSGNLFNYSFPQDYRHYTLHSMPKPIPYEGIEAAEAADAEREENPGKPTQKKAMQRRTVWAEGHLEEIDALDDDPASVMRRLERQAKATGYGMPWAVAEYRRLFDGKIPKDPRIKREVRAHLLKQAEAAGFPKKWATERTKALFG